MTKRQKGRAGPQPERAVVDSTLFIFARANAAQVDEALTSINMVGEGGLLAAAAAMDGKTMIGFIIAFCLASVISSNLSVRRETRRRAPVPRHRGAFVFVRIPDGLSHHRRLAQDWFDNLPWRKALHEKAMKIVDEAKAKEAEEEAKKTKKKK